MSAPTMIHGHTSTAQCTGQEGKSHMRCFLEDWDTFRWPDDPDQMKGSYFSFKEGGTYKLQDLMRFERILGVPKFRKQAKGTQTVKQYRIVESMQEQMKFSQCFAVKQLSREARQPEENIKEAKAMEGLRHPHIAALLGTFLFELQDHIVIFPAGCTDLGDLFNCISKDIENGRAQQNATKTNLRQIGQDPGLQDPYSWIFKQSPIDHQRRLQGYFLCLCEGLAFLHGANVRHKDIKPENIVIDITGSVVFVDFGTAVQYAPTQTTATMDPNAPVSDKYATPERMRDELRDKASDVYCLGCVFVEMISLLFGYTLKDLLIAYGIQIPKTADIDGQYYKSLPRVNSWLDSLQNPTSATFWNSAWEGQVSAAIPTVKAMIADEMKDRPVAEGLWKQFNFAIEDCKDCHPEKKTWRPTEQQKAAYDSGRQDREDLARQEQKLEQERRTTRTLHGSDLIVSPTHPKDTLHPQSAAVDLGRPALKEISNQLSPWQRRHSTGRAKLRHPQDLSALNEEKELVPSRLPPKPPFLSTVRSSAQRAQPNSRRDAPRRAEFRNMVEEAKESDQCSVPGSPTSLKRLSRKTTPPPHSSYSPSPESSSIPQELQGSPLSCDGLAILTNGSHPKLVELQDENKRDTSSAAETMIKLHEDKPDQLITDVQASNLPEKPRSIRPVFAKDHNIFVYNLHPVNGNRKVTRGDLQDFETGEKCRFFPLKKRVRKYNIYGRGITMGMFDLHPTSWLATLPMIWKSEPAYICIHNWKDDDEPEYIQSRGTNPICKFQPVRLMTASSPDSGQAM